MGHTAECAKDGLKQGASQQLSCSESVATCVPIRHQARSWLSGHAPRAKHTILFCLVSDTLFTTMPEQLVPAAC